MTRIKKRTAIAGANGEVFAFVPCKGGAGSTFLSTNFGYALAEVQGKRVALLDLNTQLGDAILYVSEDRPDTDLGTVCREIHRLDASLLSASMMNVRPNYSVLAAPEDPAHAIDVKPPHVETILKIARKHYDFVVIDIGRALDAVTLQALDMADAVFPVLQLNLPCVRNAKRLLGVLRSLGYSKSKIKPIVNRYQKSSDIVLSDAEGTLGQPIFKVFPNSFQAVAQSINQGVPILKLARNDAVSKGLREMCQMVVPDRKAEGGWLSKMLGRN